MTAQPWIGSAKFDLTFILAPAFAVTLLVLLLQGHMQSLDGVPPWAWLLLIVGVDVSHVYSTIFRTYLDREELRKRQLLYTLAPVACWLVGCALYSWDAMAFWRVLAYLAVFHFVRQQYGFMMIYARGERSARGYGRMIDKAAIYGATVYPLVYWHLNQRKFEWFIQGDFLNFDAPYLGVVASCVYAVILLSYVIKECAALYTLGTFNVPKNLLLTGTAASWFVGIVAFNNDLAFTATNVLAHGIPYIALIWIYGANQTALQKDRPSFLWPWISTLFRWQLLPVYVLLLAAMSYIEESLWDGFIWREHGSLFGLSNTLPAVIDPATLTWLVPLLALPQATHYVLDAFIWRMQTPDTNWKSILFFKTPKTS